MKNLKPHQLETLARLFVQDYCSKNQIDFSMPSEHGLSSTLEKDDADSDDADSDYVIHFGETKCEFSTGSIKPTGNTASMFNDLEIRFAVFNSDQAGLFTARVCFVYSHPSGGGNGHTLDLVIVTRSVIHKGGLPFEYVGFLPSNLLSVYDQNIANLQAENAKKKKS